MKLTNTMLCLALLCTVAQAQTGRCGPDGCALPPQEITANVRVTPVSAGRQATSGVDLDPVVRVYAKLADGTVRTATATLVSKDEEYGLVATSLAAVAGKPTAVKIWYPKDGWKAAEIDEIDEAAGLAILRTDVPAATTPVTLAETLPSTGFTAVCYGYDDSGKLLAQRWRVVSLTEDSLMGDRPHTMLGSPVYATSGHVIGLATGPTVKCAGPGPLRRMLQKIKMRMIARRAAKVAHKYAAPTPPPVVPNVVVQPDPAAGAAIGSLAKQNEVAVQKLESLDKNVAEIKNEVVPPPDKKDLQPLGVVAMIVLGLLVGGALFFMSFRHTPIT